MSTIIFRTIDSPVGLLTLAGRDGTLGHLRMVGQTHEPSRAGWERDDDAFLDAVEQLGAYFVGDLTTFDVHLQAVDVAAQVLRTPELAAGGVVLLAVEDQVKELDRYRELGIAACVMKPVVEEELLDAVCHARLLPRPVSSSKWST